MAATLYTEQATLNQWFGGTAATIPATIYVGLLDITNTELTGNGYARVAVTNNTTNWPNATGSTPAVKSNGIAVTFPTATSGWNSAQWFGLYDAATLGNQLFLGPLLQPLVVAVTNQANFPIGALVIQAT